MKSASLPKVFGDTYHAVVASSAEESKSSVAVQMSNEELPC